MNPQATVRRALDSLIARHLALQGLDWPLTARGPEPLFNIVRRMIVEAEGYLAEGQLEAAFSAVKVGTATLNAASAMHNHATMEI